MNEKEWQTLHENFETTLLLTAVGHVDALRVALGDEEYGRPPAIRDDLLKLHTLAMDIVNNGWDDDLSRLAALATGIEDEALDILHHAEDLLHILSKLTGLLPDSAYTDEEE